MQYMKIILAIIFIFLVFLAGCQRYAYPAAYPVPAQQAAYTTVSSTTSSTTSIFDCKSCQEGYICRQNQCIKVEFSNVGGGGGSGGGGGY
jgi:PBP1b-binding outer membrane lipoprotein LpoB